MSLDSSTGKLFEPASSGYLDIPIGGSPAFWAFKRAFDIVISLALLPLLILVSILLPLFNPFFNPGPVFYVQTRMGKDCQPFRAIKFRTMFTSAKILRCAHDPVETHRITKLGRLLRKTRVDELPQILNVLKGEMSLIGPRPDFYDHATEFLATIPDYRDRHMVRPGISGFAQVTLGYAAGLDATRAKAAADLAYIRNAGFALDSKILFLTLATILHMRGA